MPSIPPLHLQSWQRPRTAEPPEKEETVDPLTIECKDRYARFERTIAVLFPSQRPCCASDLQLDSFGVDDGGDHHEDGVGEAEPVRQKQTRQEEDEDYDMDEDDEEEAPPPPPPPPITSTPVKAASPEVKKNAVTTREQLEADRKASEDAAKDSFTTMFHTLENDRDAMLEQQKLEESDRQVNAEANAVGAPGKLSTANLGASRLTLKHLIAIIDAKRERVVVSDMELRNLMSEVKKNRSKWANEDKVGQEELYEAAEKVVLELRAQTEHSTAFLNRVNKREAPDYFNVIKHPMDLGQVMKKLKQLMYKSKKEFVDDIMLIWQNCLTYNADPNHYLRKHALAMKKMTLNIIPLIPDITIRDRAEVEAEEAGIQDADADAESDDEPIMSSRMNRKGPGTTKAKKGTQPVKDEGTPEVKPPPTIVVQKEGRDSPIPFHMNDHSSQQGGGSQNGFGTPVAATPVNGFLSQMDVDPAADKFEIEDDNDEEYKVWKTMTKKSRAKVASERHKLFRGGRLQGEEPALLRTRVGMGSFVKKENIHGEMDEDAKARDQIAKLATAPGDHVEEDDEMLPNYYQVMNGVPELPWAVEWRADGEGGQDDDNLRLAPPGIFVQPKYGVSKYMDSNIKLIQDTRRVCSKIGVIKQMQAQTQMYANQFTKYDPAEFIELEPEEFVVSSDDPILAPDVCRAALQRSIGKVFYHAGFEDFQPSALDVVTDIATDFFDKLAKTVMAYTETYLPTGKMAPDEIVMHTLLENGVELEGLEGYVKDDIERLSVKLEQTNQRTKGYLADLLRPALVDIENPDNTEEGMGHFISGDFSEDIGDDFFGFKDLGLDKEFGLSSLSVPMHLLQGRLSSTYQTPGNIYANSALAPTEHPAPPPFEPLTHDLLRQQISLVSNFFLAKLHANNEEPLVEDEDLPIKQRAPKPRLPPTGKITLPRKRPVNSQGGNSKKKKKPNPPASAANATAIVGGVSVTKLTPPPSENNGSKSDDGEAGDGVGMMSPESITAA